MPVTQVSPNAARCKILNPQGAIRPTRLWPRKTSRMVAMLGRC